VNRLSTVGLGSALALAALATLPACKKSEPVQAAPIAAPGLPPPGSPQGLPPGMPQGMPQGLPQLPPPGLAAGAGGTSVDAQVAALQQAVARDPKNVRAWIDLGNLYFDAKQPQRAIDAYAKALELQPNNPDVITDQGVMYRDIGQTEKAAANFRKASQLDPKHMQSLFNLGVVQAYDLKDAKAATATWNQVIQRSPNSPQAAQARQAIDSLQAAPGAR
jgi:cytochrome c-type biogenesis protein CcmH/NrfG